MIDDDLMRLLSQPPASIAWTTGEQTIGVSKGLAIELRPGAVSISGVFAPDASELAARNGTIMLLVLTAMRPDWPQAAQWLRDAMLQVGLQAHGHEHHPRQHVSFVWSRRLSQAGLRIER